MAILFDLDGTLINPQQGIFAAIRFALTEMALPIPSDDLLADWIGPPLGNSFSAELNLPDNHPKIAEAIRLFRVYYADTGLFEATIFDGIPEMLAELQSVGETLYIATSKPTLYATKIAARFGLDTFFQGIYGTEMAKNHSGKTELLENLLQVEGLRADDCTMIGDRRFDIEAAIETGMRPIGVLWGFGSPEELQSAGGEEIADTVPNLTLLLSTY